MPNTAVEQNYIVRLIPPSALTSPEYYVEVTVQCNFLDDLWSGYLFIGLRCSTDPSLPPNGANCIGVNMYGNGDGSFTIQTFDSDTGGLNTVTFFTSDIYASGVQTLKVKIQIQGLVRTIYVDDVLRQTDTVDNTNGVFTDPGDIYFAWYDYAGPVDRAPAVIEKLIADYV